MRVAFLLLLVASCHAPCWSGPVEVHGSMLEVMRNGQTQARLALRELQGEPGLVAIGAMEQLKGEFIGNNGSVWISRAGPLGTITTQGGATAGDQATLAIFSRVSRWESMTLKQDRNLAELEDWIAELAAGRGLDKLECFPFRIEGEFRDLGLHIANGSCPMRLPHPPGTEPVRRMFPSGSASLVGFYARNGAGVITHAGERTHVHVRTHAPEALAGHVEQVIARAGAQLLLPLP